MLLTRKITKLLLKKKYTETLIPFSLHSENLIQFGVNVYCWRMFNLMSIMILMQ